MRTQRVASLPNVPPVLIATVMMAISTAAAAGEWVSAPTRGVPPGAFAAGEERGEQILLCRAHHNGGVHPGKVVGRACHIGWGGKEVPVSRYEVLTRVDWHEWVGASGGTVPPRSFVGGEENGRSLYVCRARHRGGLHPGKLVGPNCNVAFNGNEILVRDYEVLSIERPAPPEPTWVRGSQGSVPKDAFVAGSERKTTFHLCRASHHGGVHPGKLVGQNCNIGWGGKEVLLSRYEILTGVTNHRWVPSTGGGVPSGSFAGGEENGRPLYVCRGEYRGGTHPGKLVGQNCNIGWGGEEILLAKYEVLSIQPERSRPRPEVVGPRPRPQPTPPAPRDCGTGRDDPGCEEKRDGVLPLAADEYAAMMKVLRAEKVEQRRRDQALTLTRNARLTARQFGAILDLFKVEQNRLFVARSLAPKVVNPRAAVEFATGFKVSHNRNAYLEVVTAQSPVAEETPKSRPHRR